MNGIQLWLKQALQRGDEPGHDFHGNQYKEGSGGSKTPSVKDVRAHLAAHGFNADHYRVSKDGKTITYKPRIVSYTAHGAQQNRLIETLKSAGYNVGSSNQIGTTVIK